MTNQNSPRKSLLGIAAVTMLSFSLAACGGDDDDDVVAVAPTPTPTPAPTPTPTPTGTGFDAAQCLQQEVAPGLAVANLVVPDVITIDPNSPAGFPNGRLVSDPVIDVTLAVLFLDINAMGQSPLTFANLPLNPPANDVAFPMGFPYLAAAQGSPPLSATSGTNFNFRTEGVSAYTRVDRMGMPAVSTALIPSGAKNAYNDANPLIDSSGEFVDELSSTLQGLTDGIGDDLLNLGLNICAD